MGPRERLEQVSLDGLHRRGHVQRPVHREDRRAVADGLPLDRLPEREVQARVGRRGRARGEPGGLHAARGHEPQRAGPRGESGAHDPGRQRRPLGHHQRRAREAAQIVDHHRAALAVQAELHELAGGPPGALPGRGSGPAVGARRAGCACPVVMVPRPRVGAVQLEPVALGQAPGHRRLARAGGPADPQDVPQGGRDVGQATCPTAGGARGAAPGPGAPRGAGPWANPRCRSYDSRAGGRREVYMVPPLRAGKGGPGSPQLAGLAPAPTAGARLHRRLGRGVR